MISYSTYLPLITIPFYICIYVFDPAEFIVFWGILRLERECILFPYCCISGALIMIIDRSN